MTIVVALMAVNNLWFEPGKLIYGPICTGLLVIILGFTGKWGNWMGSTDNISYELYLFHFPIYGMALHYGLVDSLGGLPTFALCLLVIGVMAYVFHYHVGARFLKSSKPRPVLMPAE